MTNQTTATAPENDASPSQEDGWPENPPPLRDTTPGKGGVDGYGTSLVRIGKDIECLIEASTTLRFRHYGVLVKNFEIIIYQGSLDRRAGVLRAGTETSHPRCHIFDAALKVEIRSSFRRRYKALRDFFVKWS